MANLITTVTSEFAISDMPIQRRSFYAQGRFWVFYFDGTNTVFRTSTDGITWSDATTVRAGGNTNRFTLFFNETYIDYICLPGLSGGDGFYRKGTPNADGTITWLAAEQTAITGIVDKTFYYANISIDSAGAPWVGYIIWDGANYTPYVTASSTIDGTWTTAAAFPYNVAAGTTFTYSVSPVALSAGKVYCLWGRAGASQLKGNLWSGTAWTGTEIVTTDNLYSCETYTAISNGDNVEVAMQEAITYDLKHYERAHVTGTWNTIATIAAGANTSRPTLSYSSLNNFVCFWRDAPTTNHLYYKKFNGTSWATEVDMADESANTFNTNAQLLAFYNASGGYLGVLYLTSTGSPYNLMFVTLSLPILYEVCVDWDNDGDFLETAENVSPDVKNIYYSRGKSDELGKAEVGQLSIVVNNATGKYTPGYGGVISTLLLPKRPIRIRVINQGTTYNLFYGFIEEIVPHPHLTEQDCIITAVDGIDFLSRHDLSTALYKGQPTGVLQSLILDDAGWPGTARTIDTGQDTIPYWYGADVKARFAQEEIDASEQGFSFVDRLGNFRFEERHHRSSATHQTSQGTFTNTMAYITYSLNPKSVYNIVKVTVTPWAIQAEAELWRLQETPTIPVGGTYTVWGEASVSGGSVFVDAWVTPVITTDYTASGTVSIVTTKFAKSIKLAITNTDTVPVTITLLKARGTWYDDQTKVTRKSENSTSQTTYQKRTLIIDGKYMTNAELAQDLADYAIGKYKDPRAELSMTLTNQDAATLTQILSREISDRITVVNTKLGVSADYFIDYMEHDISMGGLLHTVTYRLADCINEDFWCLGFSKLGLGTKLAY